MMKFSILTAVLGLSAIATAASSTVDPGPSPTASVGCTAHGDHWHCDGPATTASPLAAVSPSTTSSATHDDHSDHDDHDHDSLAPSPTNSIGCEPHGDHWHCDGPKVTGAANATGSNLSTSAPSTDVQTGSGVKTAVFSVGALAAVLGSMILTL